MKEGNASGKGLLHAVHQLEQLRSRHPNITRTLMPIHMDFYIAEQLRRILYFINQNRRLVQLKEHRGI